MHVVLLSDLETQGGAAIAASRLARALCCAGHRVTRLVAMQQGSESAQHPWATHVLYPPLSRRATLVRQLMSLQRREDAFDQGIAKRRLHQVLDAVRPEVINVHNLHGAAKQGWSPELLRICREYAPTVWTLHDMWSFTGRCAYSYGCRKFVTGCDASCPTPAEYPALAPERIAPSWEQRDRLFAGCSDLAAVSPSRWLAREARSGFWRERRVEVIPNGLPLPVFRPLNRSFAREALGVEARGPVLLLAAMDLVDRRKGASALVEALRRLAHRPLTVLTMGRGRLPFEGQDVHIHALGSVDNDLVKALAYSAADLFVHPALADNLPNTVMEAIACGTPTVGFPIGGVPDMVRPGQTGWLAEEVSAEGLRHALEAALGDLIAGRDLRTSCRAVAEAEYGDDLQAHRYEALFHSLAHEHVQ